MAGEFVVGAGMTGLAASLASGFPVLEAGDRPGGLCASYELEGYRFERGGGHWMFGVGPRLRRFLGQFCELRRHRRRAATMVGGELVTHPLQHNLGELGSDVVMRALSEMDPCGDGRTMKEWLEARFGPTLNDLFFREFNRRYTAGLYDRVAPPEGYKTPLDPRLVTEGAVGATRTPGYNSHFHYPDCGLGELARRMASRCDVQYGARMTAIDEEWLAKTSIISTVPLDQMAAMAGIDEADPHTAVAVVNVGGDPGPECPSEHWVYTAEARSGFHRVQFYSNVDPDFAPAGKVSMCAELACLERPDPAYPMEAIEELYDWGWLRSVDVWHLSWVNPAYTWRLPGSRWVEDSVEALARKGVHQAGRYGLWRFQGIAESLRDGLLAGAALR